MQSLWQRQPGCKIIFPTASRCTKITEFQQEITGRFVSCNMVCEKNGSSNVPYKCQTSTCALLGTLLEVQKELDYEVPRLEEQANEWPNQQ